MMDARIVELISTIDVRVNQVFVLKMSAETIILVDLKNVTMGT